MSKDNADLKIFSPNKEGDKQSKTVNPYDVIDKIKGLSKSNIAKKSASYFSNIVKDADFASLEKKPYFITVNHIVPTLPALLIAMQEAGEIVGIICKGDDKVRDKRISDWLNDCNFPILVHKNENGEDITKDALSNPETACELLKNWLSNTDPDRPVILMDIGGYFAPALPLISQDEILAKKITGIVEDTKNGEIKYQKVIVNSKIPVYSVAESRLKQREDRFVGVSIVHAADTILRQDADTIMQQEVQKIGVLGYGKIGKGIIYELQGRKLKEIYVCEKDPSRKSDASFDGCKIVDYEDLVSESDMIFSATGGKALGGSDFKKMKDNVYVVSVTSATDEMKISELEEVALEETQPSENITAFKVQYDFGVNKKINLMCRGNAANFAFNGVNGPFIFAVQANMLYAAQALLSNIGQNEIGKIIVLTPEIEDRNEKIWTQYFVETIELMNERKDNNRDYPVLIEKKGITNIPLKPATYQDRDLLKNIKENFSSMSRNKQNKIQILAGLSGSGKTQLAYEFARGFDNSWIINANSEESYKKSIDELCKNLKLNINKEKNYQEKVKILCENLAELNFALIIDDAPSRDSVKEFFEINNGPKILITSENQNWSGAKTIKVQDYSLEEAVSYIKKTLPNVCESSAENLAKLLSCHPLALSHAAHCIMEDYMSIEDYVEDYNTIAKQRKIFLEKGALQEDRNGYSKTVLSTFILSLSKVRKKLPKAAEILEESTFYDANHLIFKMFDLGKNGGQIKKILTDYSLVDFSDALFDKFKVHKLVRDVTLIHLEEQQKLTEMVNKITYDLSKRMKYNGEPSSNQSDRILASNHFARILEINKLYNKNGLSSEEFKIMLNNYINVILYAKKDSSELKTIIKLISSNNPHYKELLQFCSEKLFTDIQAKNDEIKDYEQVIGNKSIEEFYKETKDRNINKANKYYAIGKNLDGKKSIILKLANVIISLNEKMLNDDDKKIASRANLVTGKMLSIKAIYNEATKHFKSSIEFEQDNFEKIKLCDIAIENLKNSSAVNKKEILQEKLSATKEHYGQNSDEYKKIEKELSSVSKPKNIMDFFKKTSFVKSKSTSPDSGTASAKKISPLGTNRKQSKRKEDFDDEKNTSRHKGESSQAKPMESDEEDFLDSPSFSPSSPANGAKSNSSSRFK